MKIINQAKKSINNQKKKYLFLSIIILVGIISGILFIFFISKEDKSSINNELSTFFSNIKTNKLNYLNSLSNSVASNILYLLGLWVLGISIIGIPIIIFILFLKSFIFGFSFSAIISNYGLKGIPISLAYQLPHNIINLIVLLLLSFYAINFSIKLYKVLFIKQNINLNICFKRYNKILLICIITITISSIFEVFVAPYLIKLFL